MNRPDEELVDGVLEREGGSNATHVTNEALEVRPQRRRAMLIRNEVPLDEEPRPKRST